MAVRPVYMVYFAWRYIIINKTRRNPVLYTSKKSIDQNNVKNGQFSAFFINFRTFWSLDRPKSLKINFCCFHYLSWEKLVQNDMSHVILDPRINKFTALENIVLKFDCARRVFAVFRVYFAIFIYGKYSDMVFQIPQTILHPLICNKSMFWAIGRVLGR